MSKRKVELNDQVEKLVTKYMSVTKDEFNEIINEALPYYIKKKMTSKEVREAFKDNDTDDATYLDKYLQNNIHNNWGF